MQQVCSWSWLTKLCDSILLAVPQYSVVCTLLHVVKDAAMHGKATVPPVLTPSRY